MCVCAIWKQSSKITPRYRPETEHGRTARHVADNIPRPTLWMQSDRRLIVYLVHRGVHKTGIWEEFPRHIDHYLRIMNMWKNNNWKEKSTRTPPIPSHPTPPNPIFLYKLADDSNNNCEKLSINLSKCLSSAILLKWIILKSYIKIRSSEIPRELPPTSHLNAIHPTVDKIHKKVSTKNTLLPPPLPPSHMSKY